MCQSYLIFSWNLKNGFESYLWPVFYFQFIFHDNISVFAGKVGGLIASIPDVMVAALLCFMWAMLTALGLSNLRYSEAGSSRNIIIVGLSLFFSLSVPAYFQQYGISPGSNMSVPSYFQPYIVASHGPFNSKSGGVCLSLSISPPLCQYLSHTLVSYGAFEGGKELWGKMIIIILVLW